MKLIQTTRLKTADLDDLFSIINRAEDSAPEVDDVVRDIIDDVRKNGDSAVLKYSRKFDGIDASSDFNMEVSSKEITLAVQNVGEEFMAILEEARENIRRYHQKQTQDGYVMTEKPGIVLGQRVTPIDRVGVYVPGGTAIYPSTVLMNVIPAKIAGVGEITLVSPPDKNGKISDNILAAAYVAGVDRIYKMGGAQAVAALAYGTQTVKKVDKIVGPGNIYVATAKKMVFGQVGIDMIAGPSEILIIADSFANPDFVAVDMLSQAEHDRLAASFLVTDSAQLAEKVAKRLEYHMGTLPRAEIARCSIENNGRIIVVDDLETAARVSNLIAPEHLELCVKEPLSLLPSIRHAGSIFLGNYSPEALGDYFAGPNHTLPTSGTARFSSALSVDDFVKKSSIISYSKEALEKVCDKIEKFAMSEGLDAHAKSVIIRADKKEA